MLEAEQSTHSPNLSRRVATVIVFAVLAAGAASASAAASGLRTTFSRAEIRASAASIATNGLAPQDIRRAYALPSSGPTGQTIALVGAYDYPALAADLASYSFQFGLKPCTTASGCLRKLNQSGQSAPLPAKDPTGGQWNSEAALSSEVIRGVCQSCKILLVEANSPAKADLSAAVATAMRAGASVVDTTFVLAEEQTDFQFAADYTSPHSTVVSATGDLGYNGSANFPASFPSVIAVGGTHLNLDAHGRYKSESVWNTDLGSTSSGCSLYSSAPAWQAALASSVGCGSQRAIADVAAIADPGATVHIAQSGHPGGPWFEVGGTSLAAPILAGVLGLAGGGSGTSAQQLYQRARLDPSAFHDVTSGSNSSLCDVPICQARRGFDGPTGLGTPHGLAAFTPFVEILDPHHLRVSVTAPNARIHAGSRWVATARLVNHNPFAVGASATLVSRGRLRLGGRLQTVTFSRATSTVGANSSRTLSLPVRRAVRSLLSRLHSVSAKLTLRLTDPTGHTVTSIAYFRLYAR